LTTDIPPENHELSKRSWVGDCGFKSSKKSDCRKLSTDKYFRGFSFCCGRDGFCSTNCYSEYRLSSISITV